MAESGLGLSLAVTLTGATGLTAKDLNGKSDPYGIIGLVGPDGDSWVPNAPTLKTPVVKSNLNPSWTQRNYIFFHTNQNDSTGFKVQLWDKDTVGSDEFLGEYIWKWANLSEDETLVSSNHNTASVALQARAGKKDKISGVVTIRYSFLRDSTKQKLQSEAAAAQQADNEAKEAEKEVQKAAILDRLFTKIPNGGASRSAENVQKIRDMASHFVTVSKNGDALTRRQQLKDVLLECGLWEQVRLYSMWKGGSVDEAAGLSDQKVRTIQKDSDVRDTELDRAWDLFDLDHDDTIDFGELVIALGVLFTPGYSPEREQLYFDVFDKDKSGYLDMNEATKLFDAEAAHSVAVLLAGIQYDLIQDTKNTPKVKELIDQIREQGLGTQIVEKYCNIFFREVDKDGDGRITKDEWMAFMANQEARDAVQRDLLVEVQLLAKSLQPELAAKVTATVKSYVPPAPKPYVPYVPPERPAYVPSVPARKTPRYTYTTRRPTYGDFSDDEEYDVYDSTDYYSSRRYEKKRYGFKSYSSTHYDDVECFDECDFFQKQRSSAPSSPRKSPVKTPTIKTFDVVDLTEDDSTSIAPPAPKRRKLLEYAGNVNRTIALSLTLSPRHSSPQKVKVYDVELDVEEEFDSVLIPEPPERAVVTTQPADQEDKISIEDDDDDCDDIEFEDNYKIEDEEADEKTDVKLLPEDVLDRSIFGPVPDASWPVGLPVPFIHITRTLSAIEKISARLKILDLMGNMLRGILKFSPQDLIPTLYLCTNKVYPAHTGIELGLGDSLLMRAISESTGRSIEKLKSDYVRLGDWGLVAQESRSKQRYISAANRLSVDFVYKVFQEICNIKGHSSQMLKREKIKRLLSRCHEEEAKFIVRSLQGRMRIGALERTILSALADVLLQHHHPELYEPAQNRKANLPQAVKIVKRLYAECPSYDDVIPVLLGRPLFDLKDINFLKPLVPVKPMLAQPSNGVEDAFQTFGDRTFLCQYKYDGERLQIHFRRNEKTSEPEIELFSRSCERCTLKYPDVADLLRSALPYAASFESIESFIVDAEVVAWDPDSKQILPFQRLTTRAKKWVNHGRDPSVKVALFLFDFLLLNNQPLIMEELRQRLKRLHEVFKQVPDHLFFAEEFESKDLLTVQNFFAKSLKSSCEGLMMKCLDGPDSVYRLDYRSNMWLKIKKDYAGMVDTLDLVPIGGFYGQGRRVGVFGSFLLAVYDPDQDEYQSISKCMTGFTDQFLITAAEELGQTSIDAPLDNYRFSPAVRPDVFFKPTQVWEIQFADFTLSTVHCAAGGLIDEERAVSLRFPRFKRARTDKKPVDATTPMQIAEFYWKLQNDPDLDTFFNRTEAKDEDPTPDLELKAITGSAYVDPDRQPMIVD